jgi:hypothetical protein
MIKELEVYVVIRPGNRNTSLLFMSFVRPTTQLPRWRVPWEMENRHLGGSDPRGCHEDSWVKLEHHVSGFPMFILAPVSKTHLCLVSKAGSVDSVRFGSLAKADSEIQWTRSFLDMESPLSLLLGRCIMFGNHRCYAYIVNGQSGTRKTWVERPG